MAQIGTIRLQTQNNGTVSVPVFNTGDSGNDVYEFVRVQTSGGTGFIPVVDPSSASFPYLRVQSQNQGVVAVHNEATLLTFTLVDDFEDGDMSEYAQDNAGKINAVTDRSFNGSRSCRIDSERSTKAFSSPGDGLNAYPQIDDTIQFYFYISDLQGANATITFMADGSTSYNEGIAFHLRDTSGNGSDINFDLYSRVNGDIANGTTDLNTGQWYQGRLTIGSDNNHEAQLLDTNDNVIETLTGSDSGWSNNGAFGFWGNDFTGGRSGTTYFDYVRIRQE